MLAIVDRGRRFEQASLAGPVEQPAVEAREQPALFVRRQCDTVGHRQRAVAGAGDQKPQARLNELLQIRGEIGRRGDQPAAGVQIVPAQRAVARRRCASLVAIVDEHAEAVAEHRKRDAQLDAIAVRGGLPRAIDARFLDRDLLAQLARLDAPAAHGAGARGGDEDLPLLAVGILEAEPDPVAERCAIERVGVRAIEHELVIGDIEQRVEHALVHAGENAESILAVTDVGPRLRLLGPFVGVAIEKRLTCERHGLQIERLGLRVLGGAVGPIQQITATLQRSGDGLSDRGERLLLAFAQDQLHLARVLAPGPGQHQGQQADQQELQA